MKVSYPNSLGIQECNLLDLKGIFQIKDESV